ncbi:sulfite exporter TauE/SafE family protein [Streptomyces sp. NBC_01373]|uniref:sulfite exporter TauE/SafE family protein n=1 Tax=Streptomyces sp. NBC_01373 TaxID=2903843 RepID=UPI00224E2DB4|nr:sulfite exporter TauE/SafE family protein [Streptomyces sp. NBC_01373]MCX4699118.1 sulfite exporter TauE/SafE family protein [Streptomyces sp. NBC_01373]
MTTSGWAGDVLLTAIVLLGSSVQWLTGMGFALVAVPALILLLGPAEGVVLANCAAGAISVVGLVGGWRQVRWAAMLPLCVAAACTVPAGTWVTRQLREPVLLLAMGGLVTVAVLLVMRGARVRALRGTGGALAAGAAGGFMNAAAGVGGPPMSLYAVNAGWTVREFVPNAQFYGVVVNAFSVASNGLPSLSTPRWVSVGAAMVVGALIGRGLAGRLPEERARLLVLVLALGGGVTAVGKGLWGL